MSTPTPPFAVQAVEGIVVETPTGDSAVVKADTEQTNGSLTVIELVIGPQQGPALHKHRNEDELWFVLDGTFRFKAGDAMFRASTGGMAFGPRGTPHCFQNLRDEPGRLLIVTTPSGAVLLGLRRQLARRPRHPGPARRDRARPRTRVHRATASRLRPDLVQRAAEAFLQR